MQPKPFAMGVRIEHPQAVIDRAQYGKPRGELPPADYKLAVHLPDGGAAYTFCMCPGGQVVAAASQPGGVVTNGMSYAARGGENANSALLASVTPEDSRSPARSAACSGRSRSSRPLPPRRRGLSRACAAARRFSGAPPLRC